MVLIKVNKNLILGLSASAAAVCTGFAVAAANGVFGTDTSVIVDNRPIGYESTVNSSVIYAAEKAADEQNGTVSELSGETVIKSSVLMRWGGEDTDVSVPSDVIAIGNGAFKDIAYIKTVHFGTDIKSIGFGAFSGCESLTDIYYGGTREQWNNISFAGLMPSDISVHFEAEKPVDPDFVIDGDGTLKGYSGNDHIIKIPDGVTAIAAGAFREKTGITEVILPDGVKSIGDKAFMYCTSLNKVVMPDTVISLGAQAFYGCTSLETVRFSDNITEIGIMAFMFCSSLNGAELPSSLLSVGAYAFDSCYSLKKVVLPKNIRYIGETAFPVTTEIVYPQDKELAEAAETFAASGIVDIRQITYEEPSTVTIPENVFVIRDNDLLADGDEVSLGDVLYIKAVPPAGCRLGTLTADGGDIENSSSFVVGNTGTVIEVSFISDSPVLSFTEGVSVFRGNAVLSEGEELEPGEELFVKAIPPKGYDVGIITVNGERTENNRLFTVGDTDTDIDVEYVPVDKPAGNAGITSKAISPEVFRIFIPENVAVFRGSEPLYDGSEILENDMLLIKALSPEGAAAPMLRANGIEFEESSFFIVGKENVLVEIV